MKRTLAPSLCLLLSSGVYAQNIELTPISVESSAFEKNELDASDAVEIYTAKDIEESHAQTLYEFFNKYTSVSSASSYGNPLVQRVYFNGYSQENGYQNVVITVNGRRLNNIDLLPQLLSSISPGDVERIEIIKGNGIVEYGDGANAGVINIITKKTDQKTLTLYGGTQNTTDGSVYIGSVGDMYEFAFSGELYKNDGIRFIDAQGDKDKQSFKNAALDVSFYPTKNLQINANAETSVIDATYAGALTSQQYDQSTYQQGDNGYTQNNLSTDSFGGGAAYDIIDDLSVSVNYDFTKTKSTFNNVSPFWGTYESVSYLTYNQADAAIAYEKKYINVKAGFEGFWGERKANYQGQNKIDKDSYSGYVLAESNFANNTIKGGYRYEKVQYHYDADSTANQSYSLNGFELSYNRQFNEENSLFVSFAHAYQSPDIDRFFTQGGAFTGFLQPMTSNTYTLGYNWLLQRNKLRANIYYTDLHNEIFYYVFPSDPGLNRNINIDQTYKYGLNLSDTFIILEELNIAVNYAYTKAIIRKETRNGIDYGSNELPGVPNHTFKGALNYLPIPSMTLSLIEVFRSSAYAEDNFANTGGKTQQNYNSTDFTFLFKQEGYDIFANVYNIFNQKNGIWINDNAIYPTNFATTAIAGVTLKF